MANIFFIIPAGGIGSRMQTKLPKQYLCLHDNRTVIECTLALFNSIPCVAAGYIGLSSNDDYFNKLNINKENIFRYIAGETRSQTVLNGLKALEKIAKEDDWIIVHDAARPGLIPQELISFIDTVIHQNNPIGTIMALKATDTIKKVTNHKIDSTIDREMIYLAQTPQMFRYGILKKAYQTATDNNITITDESSAVEALGYQPNIYEGYAHNFKITHPHDLQLMQFLYKERDK